MSEPAIDAVMRRYISPSRTHPQSDYGIYVEDDEWRALCSELDAAYRAACRAAYDAAKEAKP